MNPHDVNFNGNSMGYPTSIAPIDEVYSEITFTKLS